MKRISQKSFEQAGVVVLEDDRIIPFYKGENPLTIGCQVAALGENIKVKAIFQCFNPLESEIKFPSLSNMWELRTGFKNIAQYGYNAFIDKGVYC